MRMVYVGDIIRDGQHPRCVKAAGVYIYLSVIAACADIHVIIKTGVVVDFKYCRGLGITPVCQSNTLSRALITDVVGDHGLTMKTMGIGRVYIKSMAVIKRDAASHLVVYTVVVVHES